MIEEGINDELKRLVSITNSNPDVGVEEFLLAKQLFLNFQNFFKYDPSLSDLRGIPKQFLCPISGELMKDPVIVSTGQTYDRRSIRAWSEEGFLWCFESLEILQNKELVPNKIVHDLISEWRLRYFGNGRDSAKTVSIKHMFNTVVYKYLLKLGFKDLALEFKKSCSLVAEDTSNFGYAGIQEMLKFIRRSPSPENLNIFDHSLDNSIIDLESCSRNVVRFDDILEEEHYRKNDTAKLDSLVSNSEVESNVEHERLNVGPVNSNGGPGAPVNTNDGPAESLNNGGTEPANNNGPAERAQPMKNGVIRAKNLSGSDIKRGEVVLVDFKPEVESYLEYGKNFDVCERGFEAETFSVCLKKNPTCSKLNGLKAYLQRKNAVVGDEMIFEYENGRFFVSLQKL